MRKRIRSLLISLILLIANCPTGAWAASYTFTPIDAPFLGVTSTIANGINASGHFVGFYQNATGAHGFLDDGSVFSTIDVPFAGTTDVRGINASEQIVGFYGDTRLHAFVANPVPQQRVPGPSSLFLLGFGLTALASIAAWSNGRQIQ